MILDPFHEYTQTPEGPLSSALIVTPSDTDDCPVIGRALNISREIGDTLAADTSLAFMVRASLMNGETVTLSLTCGVLHEIRVKKLHATGTAAGLTFTTLW